MGIYTEGLAARQRAKRLAKIDNSSLANTRPWEIAKRKLNVKLGNHEAKGLKGGRCNRTACQEPLSGRQQWFMIDHEQHNPVERLYYCEPCARMFNESDERYGTPVRCTHLVQ